MAEPICLFLGAGASKAFGYPITADILPLLAERLGARTLFPTLNVVPAIRGDDQASVNSLGFLNDAMGALRKDLTAFLPSALSPAALRPPVGEPLSVTDLLSLIDHMVVSERPPLPAFSTERLIRLRGLVQRGIATVVSEPSNAARAASEADRLQRLVAWLVSRRLAGDAIVTTNYDMTIERPLVTLLTAQGSPHETPLSQRIDYGCSWREAFGADDLAGPDPVRRRPQNPELSFFKLHGSINWLHCGLCEHVYINPTGTIFQGAYVSRFGPESTCACGHRPLSTLLVAPSMVRDVRNPTLLSIWQSALDALRRAKRWVFVGYSLPAEDLAIRSTLIRAYRTAPSPPDVEVYEDGPKPTVRLRYELLFGEKTRMFEGGMAEFVDNLPKESNAA